MTSQNQQPQRSSPQNQSPGYAMDPNPARTTSQRTLSSSHAYPAQSYQQTILQTQKSQHRREHTPLVVFVLLLTILVAVGAILSPNLFTSNPGSGTSFAYGATGPFVKAPLDSAQVNAIMHLTSYMKYKQLAGLYVSHMTLDEELGQLLMVEYFDSSYSPDLDTMITKFHAGGVIMYAFQMQTFEQTKHDIAEMQQNASIPLLIATDQEGGYVNRLANIYGYRTSATDIFNTGNPKVATQQGQKDAHDLLSLGINENLAPDVDVNLVNGYDMQTRTFGNTPQDVITYAGAYLKALQGAGVIGTIKHYPGLGDAVPDAHATLPVVNRTKDQIYSVELAPFKALIQSPDRLLNPGVIMPTDVLMPAIDPVYPAELSHIFMTDILRKQFGYDGVALTDALYMTGVAVNGSRLTIPQAAIMALNAGDDMILGAITADEVLATINAFKAALQDGTLSKARVDEAATRIIALKMEYHLMPAVPPQE